MIHKLSIVKECCDSLPEIWGKFVEQCAFPALFYVSVTRVQHGQLWYSENKQGLEL